MTWADAVRRARDRSSWLLVPALWYRRTSNHLAFIHLKAHDVGVSRLPRPKHRRNTNVSTQQTKFGAQNRCYCATYIARTLCLFARYSTSSNAAKESIPRIGSFSAYPKWLSVETMMRRVSSSTSSASTSSSPGPGEAGSWSCSSSSDDILCDGE